MSEIVPGAPERLPFHCPWCKTERPELRVEIRQERTLAGDVSTCVMFCGAALYVACDRCNGKGETTRIEAGRVVGAARCQKCGSCGRVKAEKPCGAILGAQLLGVAPITAPPKMRG